MASPFSKVIFDFESPNILLKYSIKYLLALPSTGGALIFIFHEPSASQMISLVLELGLTLTFSFILNKNSTKKTSHNRTR